MQQKVAIIIGTRPEAIKLIPVYLKFKADQNDFDVVLVSTGQHKEMLAQIFEFFNVEPDIEINVMTESQTLASLSAALLVKGDELIKQTGITHVFVQGDTTTAMIFGLVAFYNKVEVVHIEAGLRTYNNYSPFPEEVNRKIISQFATLHFCPTETASNALLLEKISEHVYNVGNTVIDSLLYAKDIILTNKGKYVEYFEQYFPADRKIILVTCHRRENFGSGLKSICDALLQLANKYPDCQFVYPVHLNPNVTTHVYNILGDQANITLLQPLPYDYLVYLLMKSYIILTDSGGIQEEAPALNKPVIVLRDTTERPEVITVGAGILAGVDADNIVKIFSDINDNESVYQSMINKENPYGDGTASSKILIQFNKYIGIGNEKL